MEKLTLSNASKTFRPEYWSESGTLCHIQYARILALRLDAFDNSYFASNPLAAEHQRSDQDVLTLPGLAPTGADALSVQPAVLSVEGWMTSGLAGRDMTNHLVRNGVAAEAERPMSGHTAGEAILGKCRDIQADLLVKGAYTQSGRAKSSSAALPST